MNYVTVVSFEPHPTNLTLCSECDPLICEDAARTLIGNPTTWFYNEGNEESGQQDVCCLPACADVGGDAMTPCTCADNEYQTADPAVSTEPFTGTCEPCPDGEAAPPFATAADQCAAPAGCEAGSFQLDAGGCIDCLTPSRCLGDQTCEVGSVGIACGSCDLAAVPKYYAQNGECVQCPEDTSGWTIVLSIGAILGFMVALNYLTDVKPDAPEGAVKVLASIVSIAFGQFQVSVLIFSLPSIPWPLELKALMQYLRNIAFFSFADFARPECEADVNDPAEMFLAKFFLKQALFVVLFGVFVAMFLVGTATSQMRLQHHSINSMIALYSVSFMLLIRSNAAIWDCTTHPAAVAQCSDPAFTTEADCPCEATWLPAVEEFTALDEFPDLPCYEGVWNGVAVYSAINLLFFAVLIPLFLLKKLSSHKSDGTLIDPDNKAKFGWLFLRYKYHVCHYYEFVTMARKALLVLVGMFFSTSPWAVFVLIMVVMSGSLVLHVVLRPYADHELDHSDEDSHDKSVWTDPDVLDAVGLVCSIVSLAFGMYYLDLGDNPEKTTFYYTVSVVALVVAIVPLALSVKFALDAHKKQNNTSDKPSETEGTEVENPAAME